MVFNTNLDNEIYTDIICNTKTFVSVNTFLTLHQPGIEAQIFFQLKLTQIWQEFVIDGGRLLKFVLEIKLMFCNWEIVTKTLYFPTAISPLFILDSQAPDSHIPLATGFHQESLIVIDDEIIAGI